MLDPTWALTRPILWLALAGVLALLVVRSIRKDRREYQRFKRYRSTARRQAMFRRWLRQSFLSFGGLSLAVLLLAGGFVEPLLQQLTQWNVLRDIRGALERDPLQVIIPVAVVVAAVVVITAVAVVAARKEQDVTSVGDIQAMLPRNRQELALGAVLSINAGVVEELLFRLALPALVFGATGNAVVAVLFPVLLFGALHIYQGKAGVIATTVVGAIMMAIYVVTGSIVVPVVLHALFDLRSLVLIPAAVFGVHRIDGRKQPYIQRRVTPKPTPTP